uniref:ATP synthase F0 subunit 8 n=1 Tax=Melanotrichia acclivopennis TaxID=2904888 RepID=A0A9E8LPU0_9NEOP|nr:ATP synthase F0 subunit 8 [Melanotrichia acclivopennis]UZZ44146.1 ATP synthase F0 subunit 8 [Melanotrichia acclivopennis]
MPQMNPMNWMIIFFYFITLIMVMNSIMFFNKSHQKKFNFNKNFNKIKNMKLKL